MIKILLLLVQVAAAQTAGNSCTPEFIFNSSGLCRSTNSPMDFMVTPGSMTAGVLPGTVIASSIAVNAVLDASIVTVSGSKVSGNITGSAPPNGTAGGSLSGSYPNPTVASIPVTIATIETFTSSFTVLAAMESTDNTVRGKQTVTSTVTVQGGSGGTYSLGTSSGINVSAGYLTVGETVNNFTVPSSSWNIVCVCPTGTRALSGGCLLPSSVAANLTASYASTNTAASGLWGSTDPAIATTASANSWVCKWSVVSTTAKCQVRCARIN